MNFRRCSRATCSTLTCALGLLVGSASSAAQVELKIEGLSGDLADAARANVGLQDYADRDASSSEIRRVFEAADNQIKQGLEPFGYYNVEVNSRLELAAGDKYRAVFNIEPGEPVIVRAARVEVHGPAAEVAEISEALRNFEPKVGTRLDHAQYEQSKSVIDSHLQAWGFLDAELVAHRVEVVRGNNSASIELLWQSGERYRFGEVRFPDVQLSPQLLPRYIPWKQGDYYSTEQLLTMQQSLVDADYFSAVSVRPDLEAAHDGVVPVDVLLVPDKRTLYTGEIYISTDSGPGARISVERRWLNKRGHKLEGHVEYSQRLQEYGLTYRVPRPGQRNRFYTYGAAYRDEETDTSRSRMARLAATQSTERWHGYTRTLGLQYLNGDFEIADEQRSTNLLYAEGMLVQKRADDMLFPRRGRSLLYGVRLAPESPVSDTTLAQLRVEARWIRPVQQDGRLLLRAAVGAMAADDFDALPPELRFFAGGDRSVRGFDYQAIGETNATGGIIGGKFLTAVSTEYEHYFLDDWGAAIFVDAGDAFSSQLDMNVGAGIGVRWRSPVGVVRLDFARPVSSDLQDSWRVHLVIGPDL